MITKKELLKNIRNYSPPEIAEAVRAGVVSLYELSKETDGAFTPLFKRQVKAILDSPTVYSQGVIPKSMDSEDCNRKEAELTQVVQPTMDDSNLQVSSTEPMIQGISSGDSKLQNKEANTIEEQMCLVASADSKKKPAMFSRLFSLRGRIRRREYCLTYLMYCLWNLPVQVMPAEKISDTYAIFYLLTLLPILWIVIAQGTKRCHDRGNSGWYQIIPFYLLWMLFGDGEEEYNEYGESPKYN